MAEYVKAELLYWKLAIWKAFSGCFLLGAAGYMAFLTQIDWMPKEQKLWHSFVVGTLIAMTKFLDGFLDQTASRLIAGKPLIQLPGQNGNSHTEVTTHTEMTSTTTKGPLAEKAPQPVPVKDV